MSLTTLQDLYKIASEKEKKDKAIAGAEIAGGVAGLGLGAYAGKKAYETGKEAAKTYKTGKRLAGYAEQSRKAMENDVFMKAIDKVLTLIKTNPRVFQEEESAKLLAQAKKTGGKAGLYGLGALTAGGLGAYGIADGVSDMRKEANYQESGLLFKVAAKKKI